MAAVLRRMDALPPPAILAHAPCHTHPHSLDTNSPPPCSDTPHIQAAVDGPADSRCPGAPNNSCEILAHELRTCPTQTRSRSLSRHKFRRGTVVPYSQPDT